MQGNEIIAGWLDSKNSIDGSVNHKIYLCEPELDKEFYLFTVPVEAMNKAEVNKPTTELVEAVRIALLAYKANKAKIEDIPGFLALYIKATETYELAVKHAGSDTALHILINVYGRLGDPTAALRPAVIGLADAPKSSKEIIVISNELMLYDKEENPSFFTTI